MSGIRGANTQPELLVRSLIHRRGYRFTLHDRRLPGRPDIVLPKYGVVIFVNGCFWHRHGCHMFKWPQANHAFWRAKIGGTVCTDAAVRADLQHAGWRVLYVWECALKGRYRLPPDGLAARIDEFIRSHRLLEDIPCRAQT